MFAGGNENIPICIRRRVVRRGELACELVGRIDERVIEVEEPWRSLVLRTCLQTLATGARNILKHAAALDDARHLDDVVLTVRSEQPELPVERCMVDPYVPAQPGFLRARNDLLEGGSDTKNPSSRQGFAGLEHASSSGVGARFASEYPV